MTEARSRVIQFTDPFMRFQSSAILKRPRSNRKHERARHTPRRRTTTTTPSYKTPNTKIRTLQELHESGIAYGVVTGSQTARLFETSSDPLLQQMWMRMMTSWPSPFAYNAQEGVQRAEHEEYAFITDSTIADYVTTRKPCHLYKTANFLEGQFYAFMIQRDSDEGNVLREQLNVYLNQMSADGTLSALISRWWQSECDNRREVKVRGQSQGQSHVTKSKSRVIKTTVSPWRHMTVKTGELAGNGTNGICGQKFYLIVVIVMLRKWIS